MQPAVRNPAGKTRPALRLVSTKDMERETWLDVRKQGIGGSDAAAAVGLNPYCSQLELWLIKTGRDGNLPKVDLNDEESPMFWGTLLEPVVAALAAKRGAYRVRKVNAVLQHPDHPWMLANLDREITGNNEVQILECKTAGINGARLWRDGVPEYVQLQVQHQLAVTGKQAADVAVLICGQQLEVHRIERNEALIARLIELERRFWHYVETDMPPPADGTASADVALRCLFPQDSGETVNYSDDRNLSATFADWISVRQTLAETEKIEAKLKQTLQQAMGTATRAVFETGSVTWKKSKDSIGIDLPALLKDFPELAQRYATTKPGSRRFLIA